MLKAEVINDGGKSRAHIQVNGTILEILADLSVVIYSISRSIGEDDRDGFRLALPWAALDEDSPFWNLPNVAGGDVEVDHGK